jgi:fatty acid desaturase
MTHAEARHALSIGLEDQIAELRVQRPARRIAEIAFFAALWIAGILLGAAGIPLSAAALNAFYLLSHEGHHGLLFRNRFLNHVVNIILCIPLLHSPSGYRVLHDLHHKFLGGPGDPDEYRNYTSDSRVRWALQWIRLTMGTLVYMPMIPIVAWRRADRADRIRLVLECSLIAAVLIPIFAIVPIRILLQVWLIPGVVVGYISAVRALAQHALTESDDPLLASRSVRSNRVVAFLLLNENFHLEHHLFPEVPSYNLPRLRELLRSRLPRRVEAPSYTRFLARFVARFLRGDESPMGLVTL